jgi:hypothetical protein
MLIERKIAGALAGAITTGDGRLAPMSNRSESEGGQIHNFRQISR